MGIVDIIIPTFDNWEYLSGCLQSVLLHRATPGLAHITIINNGHEESIPEKIRKDNPEVTVLYPGKNLGWEGGLKLGLEKTTAPFVVFMNDDTYVPFSSATWLLQMLQGFSDSKVAAVGPSSNVVMGVQNIFIPCVTQARYEVNYLIGFCVMVRRDYLMEIGGVDDSMPNHGDDLDLGIRFREAGYKLLCDKNIYIYHHGFKTGQREFGAEWNSVEMSERTNHHLIRKHGLKKFVKYIFNPVVSEKKIEDYDLSDREGDLCRKYATGEVLELGCGGRKTVDNSLGVDIVPRGEFIPGLVAGISVADVTADIKEKLPFDDSKFDTVIVRHLLEHLVDPIKVINDWRRVLKYGGKLIIAVPDEDKRKTIPLNYQHVHAYNMDSLMRLMETLGFKTESVEDTHNDISILGVFSKNGHK